MFRFSVRDLLWLTLVVAVGLASWLREQQLQAEAERTQTSMETAFQVEREASEAVTAKWELRTRAVQMLLEADGWSVTWDKADKAGESVAATWPTAGEEESHKYLTASRWMSLRDINPNAFAEPPPFANELPAFAKPMP